MMRLYKYLELFLKEKSRGFKKFHKNFLKSDFTKKEIINFEEFLKM
jgi:hypothetical protein